MKGSEMIISARMVRASTIRPIGKGNEAVSIDEYIEQNCQLMDRTALCDLYARRETIRQKLLEPGAAAHRDLVANAEHFLMELENWFEQGTSDPPPKVIAEMGVGLQYLLKGMDLIPDSVPEVGYVDDARLLARVVGRNSGSLDRR